MVVPYLAPRLSPWWLSSLSPHRFRSRVVAAVVAMVAVEAVMAVVVVLVKLVVLGGGGAREEGGGVGPPPLAGAGAMGTDRRHSQ